MASKTAIATVLAYLHELYPTREIQPATAQAWAMVFAEWPDDELQACAMKAAAERGRTFFPTPGEISAYRAIPTVDAAAILRRISKLGTYNPNRGWIYPRIETVRAALGDAIANAYSEAGTDRCFADDDSITQGIAHRMFEKCITETATKDPSALQLSAPSQPLLPAA